VVAIVTVSGNGACHDDGVWAMMPSHDDHVSAMMPASMVIERNFAMAAVMQALTVLVDDPDAVVVSMVGSDNHIGLGCRSYGRQADGKRQRAHDHCFHCSFSIS